MCSLVLTMIKPYLFTSISLSTSALLENHPGYTGRGECSHALKQPYTHPIQVFWLQFLKLFPFGPSLFSLQFPKILQGWINFNQVKTFHDVFPPIVSMYALEIDCLRKGAVFTCPVKPRHIVVTSEKVPENIFICSIQNRMLLLWCICSATVTNPASSLCPPSPKCTQRQGCIQVTMEELGSTSRGDREVNTTAMAEAAEEGFHHLNHKKHCS